MKTRAQSLEEIRGREFDVCVIGGGATGSGCALDAQLRGLKTVLIDAGDFAGGTSSTSTKIVHGGVRYLEEAVKGLDPAQYRVVTRALHERRRMLKNTPHLAHKLEFLLPCYSWFEAAYYDAGLKVYDWISGDARIFPSHFMSREATLRRSPGLAPQGLAGAIAYADGQFDDARYNMALVETFAEAGGCAANYVRVLGFARDAAGRLRAAQAEDQRTHEKFEIPAKIFVNATGPFADTVRAMASPAAPPRMRLSKGIHILLPLDVMDGADALLIPKTADGRVLFAIPWVGRLLVGTTEQEVGVHDELFVTSAEVDYVLGTLNRYLARPARRDQVVSGIAGARPLVSRGGARETKKLARDHEIEVDQATGLVSIMGGKWTTHRAMAEDTIDTVQDQLRVPRTASPTRDHTLAGSEGFSPEFWKSLMQEHGLAEAPARHLAGKFGTRAPRILALIREDASLAQPLLAGLPELRAEVVYSARFEMAVTIEDVLFRRTGVQLYSWKSAIQAAPDVGAILRNGLGWSAEEERSAVEAYTAKILRYFQLAGLAQK